MGVTKAAGEVFVGFCWVFVRHKSCGGKVLQAFVGTLLG